MDLDKTFLSRSAAGLLAVLADNQNRHGSRLADRLNRSLILVNELGLQFHVGMQALLDRASLSRGFQLGSISLG